MSNENQEAVVETAQKNQTDEQWNKYNETENSNKDVPPSERQKGYITALAKNVGLKIDITKVKDKKEASVIIERFKQLNRQMNGNAYGNNNDLRDKKVAFGLATKLVFRQYSEKQKDPIRFKKFWTDVQKFYKAYQEHQEEAILGL